jgi:hypothetical protein
MDGDAREAAARGAGGSAARARAARAAALEAAAPWAPPSGVDGWASWFLTAAEAGLDSGESAYGRFRRALRALPQAAAGAALTAAALRRPGHALQTALWAADALIAADGAAAAAPLLAYAHVVAADCLEGDLADSGAVSGALPSAQPWW